MTIELAVLALAVTQLVLTIRIVQLFNRSVAAKEAVEDLQTGLGHAQKDVQDLQSDLSNALEQLKGAQATSLSAVDDVAKVAGTVRKMGEALKRRGHL